MKAVIYLRQQAKVLHAKALDRLAQQVAAHLGDPFAQVTNMIEQMIFRLMAEQKDEDDHKNWCDKEISKTEKSIDDKEDKVEELSAKIEDAEGTIAELTEDIKDAQEKIAEIVAFMNEATEIRKEGKAENKVAMKDAQDAQAAIANAVAVLTDFYKSSGEIAMNHGSSSSEVWICQTSRTLGIPLTLVCQTPRHSPEALSQCWRRPAKTLPRWRQTLVPRRHLIRRHTTRICRRMTLRRQSVQRRTRRSAWSTRSVPSPRTRNMCQMSWKQLSSTRRTCNQRASREILHTRIARLQGHRRLKP